MNDPSDPPPLGAAAVLEAVESALDTSAMEDIQRELLASVLEQIDLSALTTNFNALIAESVTKLATDLASHINTAAANAIVQIDRAALDAAINAATRDITDRAAVIGAVEKSGYRAVLYKIADEHHGFVTTALARTAGVPPVEVRKLAARGGMTNIARGLYRVDGVDGGDQAAYAEAVLRVGDDAHLTGDTVLAFHGLALVNPPHITIGSPRRVRRDLPAHIRVVRSQPDAADLTHYERIPSITVERAIRDSIGSIMPERLADAVRHAADEGLLRRAATTTLLHEIGAAA